VRFFAGIRERMRTLLGRHRAEKDLAEELRFHIERAVESNLRSGLSAGEARRRAMLAFGGVDRTAEEVRDARGLGVFEDLIRDSRYALRALRQQKGHTAAVLTTLTLGVGATTAVFSVVSALLLRPLPFAEPERLVQMHGTSRLEAREGAVVNLDAYRRSSESLEALVGYEVTARYRTDADEPERLMTVQAESGFFSMLGIAPRLGRVFEQQDGPTVVVASEAYWRRRLGGDASAIGRTVHLDGQAFTLIGVMPSTFQFPYRAASLLPGASWEGRTDLWVPLVLRPGGPGRIQNVTGRLEPGVSLAAAEAELQRIAAQLAIADPERHEGRSVHLVPLRDAVVPAAVRDALLLLLGAVALVLVLACANVANLSLVRGLLRSREIAIREALGASRARLVRQFVTESALLAAFGGGLGLAVAWWGTGRVMEAASARLPRASEVGTDWRVFVFLLAVCIVATLIAGVAPALATLRRDARSVLQEAGGTNTMGIRLQRFRDSLVVGEIALAFVLVCGAAMLVREFSRLLDTDAGMDPQNVITFHLGQRRGLDDDGRRFYEIADRVAAVPGVRAAGFTQLLPLQNWGWTSNSADFTIAGRAVEGQEFPIELRYVTPGYFAALGIPLRAGRSLTVQDDASAANVVLINETLSLLYFGNDDPVGVETNRGRIVGVVADVRQVDLDRPAVPELYFPVAQNWSQLSELGMSLVVRTANRPEASVDAIRSAIRAVDDRQAIFGTRTMERVVSDSLFDVRLYLAVMAAFATIAFALALTGTYSVIARVAASRSSEFALRSALGAGARQVAVLVLSRGLLLTGIGLGLGLVMVLAVSPLLASLPLAVRPPDLPILAPIGIVILLVAALASLVPARRAARTAPASILRG